MSEGYYTFASGTFPEGLNNDSAWLETKPTDISELTFPDLTLRFEDFIDDEASTSPSTPGLDPSTPGPLDFPTTPLERSLSVESFTFPPSPSQDYFSVPPALPTFNFIETSVFNPTFVTPTVPEFLNPESALQFTPAVDGSEVVSKKRGRGCAKKEEGAAKKVRKGVKVQKKTPNGTRNTDIPLLGLADPVAARSYYSDSKTSRKVTPKALEKLLSNVSDVEERDAIVEENRAKNRDAARVSRARKKENLDTLEAENAELRQRNFELEKELEYYRSLFPGVSSGK